MTSESERIEELRRQIGQPLRPPQSLGELLEAGGSSLAPERLDEAREAWGVALNQLETGGWPAAERHFHLTLLIAPLYEMRDEKALLERAATRLDDARQCQLLRHRLVRLAVLGKDIAGAEAVLSNLDSATSDLHMDSAYRIAACYVAIGQGRLDDVLRQLGRMEGDIPIAHGSEGEVAVLRAHAIEASSGTEPAREALLKSCQAPTRFHQAHRATQSAESLKLCAASWPGARETLWNLARAPMLAQLKAPLVTAVSRALRVA